MALTTVKGSVLENRSPYGFYTTQNAVDTLYDVDISVGACWDTTRSVWIEGAAMTKQLDAAWAAGTNAGFLDTGTVASSTAYHIFVMINELDGSVDYIASLSNNWAGVTKPTNYTKGQIIGFVPRSTVILNFNWSGNSCHINYPHLFVNDTTITDGVYENYNCFAAPDNSIAEIMCFGTNGTTSTPDMDVYLAYADGNLGSAGSGQIVSGVDLTAGVSVQQTMGVGLVLTNNSGQIKAAVTEPSGSATLRLYLRSFTMPYRLEATS